MCASYGMLQDGLISCMSPTCTGSMTGIIFLEVPCSLMAFRHRREAVDLDSLLDETYTKVPSYTK